MALTDSGVLAVCGVDLLHQSGPWKLSQGFGQPPSERTSNAFRASQQRLSHSRSARKAPALGPPGVGLKNLPIPRQRNARPHHGVSNAGASSGNRNSAGASVRESRKQELHKRQPSRN